MKFSAVIKKEGDWYSAWCPELDVASQGKTIEEAVSNLKEAIELYLEDEDVRIPEKPEVYYTKVEVNVKAASPIST